MKKPLGPVKKRRKAKEEEKKLSTVDRLVRDLKAVNDERLENIITRAEEGYYDDYKTPIAYPTIALVNDLEAAGFPRLANDAKDGKWASTLEEGQEWFEEEGWRLLTEGIDSDDNP